jgi:GGDEF domain-containing protein
VRDQPDRASAEQANAERLTRAARAAQQLCDTLWESLHEELRDPSEERVRELSERLAAVSSTVALLVAAVPPVTTRLDGSPQQAADEPIVASVPADPPLGPSAHDAAPSDAVAQAPGSPVASVAPIAPADTRNSASTPGAAPGAEASRPPAVERRTPPAPSRSEPPSLAAVQPIPTRAGAYSFTKLVDERESEDPSEPLAAVQPIPIQPEIEIRDVRREEGASAWVSSVGRLLARHSEDGLPFAVLLVEIVDVARLERSETPHDLHGLVAQVESALGRGMRATDELSRETRGRYWLVAPETNGTGARMLAERLARLVRGSAIHRGIPLEVAIGIAVCPDDGIEAPALAARADLGVYSARATGRSIVHTEPPAAS